MDKHEYLTEEDVEEINKEHPEHERQSCNNAETYNTYNLGFHSEHGGVYCKRCNAFFFKEAERKTEKLKELQFRIECLEKNLKIANRKPDLKEFCVKAGCVLIKAEFSKDGSGGKFGYSLKEKPNVTFIGFKTENSVYETFLKDHAGELMAKQIRKLLRK